MNIKKALNNKVSDARINDERTKDLETVANWLVSKKKNRPVAVTDALKRMHTRQSKITDSNGTAYIYDEILENADEEYALEYANGMCWGEMEGQFENMPKYSQYVDTVNGVDVYYDYGADYYFFVDPNPTEE